LNSLEIVVAVLAAMLGGMGLCALGVFCYFMLKGMKELQQAADKVVAAVAVVGRMESLLDRNFGEGSPAARAAKSVSALSENLPMLIAGMKGFSDTMAVFFKAAFQEREVEKVISPLATSVDDSQFIPYSEEAAAQFEVERAAKSQRLDLSKEELATMRTEAPKPQPLPEETPTP
jgi:hypothetical protein